MAGRINILNENEKSNLELFCKKAKEIYDSKAFQTKTIRITFHIKAGDKGFSEINQEGPEKDNLIALVTILRQFYSPGELIYFRRVYNIVWRFLENSNIYVILL